MSLSMYQASAPVFDKMLANLAGILAKAATWAETRRIEPAVLLTARLAPDMFTLTRQVQVACDFAKGCCARLAGSDPPAFEDTETSFPELQARIARTRQFVSTFKAVQIDGTEERDIRFKGGRGVMEFKGQAYLTGFVLPNFYFHTAMAYAILRHNGLELAKGDFIGS
jgi:uncharacterized protein